MNNRFILIVDDDEAISAVLREQLTRTKTGYRVEVARSGEEALRKVVLQHFDLVISDLLMTGIDGVELLKWVKAVSPPTHLMLITAYGTKQVEEQLEALGDCQYIAKPFGRGALMTAVERALQTPTISDDPAISIQDRLDIIAAYLQVRQLATARGFDVFDRARISLATSALAKKLELGFTALGRIKADYVTIGLRTALQVTCIKVGATVADLNPEVFIDMRDMVDELKIEDLPSRDLQVTMLKWLPREPKCLEG